MSFERIGHGGASKLAPANTLESFDAALSVGVEMIEFDVRAGRNGLVLAHTVVQGRRAGNVRFEAALAHLSAPRFSDVMLGVDLKHTGCEPAVLDGLRRFGLLDRALCCSQVAPVLDRLQELEPRVHTAISIGGRLPRATHRWGDWRRRVLDGLAARRWEALMAQHRLIDAELVADVSERGARLYGWTLGDRQRIETLRETGVHGLVSGDPRLFA